MIEPQSVQAGESAVSKMTGAWPTASRSARSFAALPCATIFNPSINPFGCAGDVVSPPTDLAPPRHHWCLETNRTRSFSHYLISRLAGLPTLADRVELLQTVVEPPQAARRCA